MHIALKKLEDESIGRVIFHDEADLLDIYENAPYSLKVSISNEDIIVEEDDIVAIREYIEENSSIYDEGFFIGRLVDVNNITYYYLPHSDPKHYHISGDIYNFKLEHTKDQDLETYLGLHTKLFTVNKKLTQFKNDVPDIWLSMNELGFDLEKEITFILSFYSPEEDLSAKFSTLWD